MTTNTATMTDIQDLDQLSQDQLRAAVDEALQAKYESDQYQPAFKRQQVEQRHHDAMLHVDELCEQYGIDYGEDIRSLADDLGMDEEIDLRELADDDYIDIRQELRQEIEEDRSYGID
jgi:hypothetical protein